MQVGMSPKTVCMLGNEKLTDLLSIGVKQYRSRRKTLSAIQNNVMAINLLNHHVDDQVDQNIIILFITRSICIENYLGVRAMNSQRS